MIEQYTEAPKTSQTTDYTQYILNLLGKVCTLCKGIGRSTLPRTTCTGRLESAQHTAQYGYLQGTDGGTYPDWSIVQKTLRNTNQVSNHINEKKLISSTKLRAIDTGHRITTATLEIQQPSEAG